MGNVCGSTATVDAAAASSSSHRDASGTAGATAVVTTTNGNGPSPCIKAATTAAAAADTPHQQQQACKPGSTDAAQQQAPDHEEDQGGRRSAEPVGSMHGLTRDGSPALTVAPAPPPDEYPEIRAAVQAAQKEVKAGAKLKFASLYKLGQVIGTGHYARVQLATSVKSGQRFAVKILKKADGKEALLLQLQNLVKEVAIMRLLSDHPNAVQLHQVLQDSTSFYLVMEHCNGGEIFDQIIRSGHMTEAMAANKAEQLLSFLAHAHAKHVIHRDIKPENLLLTRPPGAPEGPEGLVLKVVDYGCSTFCVPGKRLCKKFGTPYYVAPEVLWRDYDIAADVWSAGVVLFILLSGRLPFNGRNDNEIVSRVRTGHYRMLPDDWRHVSLEAQGLVKLMLKLDTTGRPAAAELLQHPWFQHASKGLTDAGDRGAELASAAPSSMSHVVARLEAFAGMSRMKRLALVVLCHTVTDTHLVRLKEAFANLDHDGDGHLTPGELHNALRSTGALAKAGLAAEIDTAALEGLIAASDLYCEGFIDMDEFLAAMVANSNYSKSKDALRRSFDALDIDHDGFISASDLVNLQAGLAGDHHMTARLAEDMMSEVSSCISDNHERKMDFEEFCQMMADSSGGAKTPFGGKRVSHDLAKAEAQQQQQQQQQ